MIDKDCGCQLCTAAGAAGRMKKDFDFFMESMHEKYSDVDPINLILIVQAYFMAGLKMLKEMDEKRFLDVGLITSVQLASMFSDEKKGKAGLH